MDDTIDDAPMLPSNNVVAGSQAREWHDTMKGTSREHFIQKIIRAMVPPPGRGFILEDEILRDIEKYARKLEREVFDTATSKIEYFHSVVEKYYQIRRDQEARIPKRRVQKVLSSGQIINVPVDVGTPPYPVRHQSSCCRRHRSRCFAMRGFPYHQPQSHTNSIQINQSQAPQISTSTGASMGSVSNIPSTLNTRNMRDISTSPFFSSLNSRKPFAAIEIINPQIPSSGDEIAGSQATEWRDTINKELRESVIQNLKRTILPFNLLKIHFQILPTIIEERIMRNLDTFMRKVESEIFNSATSKSEYHRLVTEKSYTIQKELENRRQKRKDAIQLGLQWQQENRKPIPQQAFPTPQSDLLGCQPNGNNIQINQFQLPQIGANTDASGEDVSDIQEILQHLNISRVDSE